jgi:hypothetical protein
MFNEGAMTPLGRIPQLDGAHTGESYQAARAALAGVRCLSCGLVFVMAPTEPTTSRPRRSTV